MAGEQVSSNDGGLSKFTLDSVEITSNVLGSGSYASEVEVNYHGLKCVGKKIHEILLTPDDDTYFNNSRLIEEIQLLSEVRHPNIVQFLGVCFQDDSPRPILVMEFLPTNLTICLHQYGILPKEISFSILHDIALGLTYLHGQMPSIIHRDLSSNNILLTNNMTAKISDLSRMTQIPGTPMFMPPEVMVANPRYDTSVDIFSLGIMMIHMFTGSWPEPQHASNHWNAGRLIPLSEAERREKHLCLIDEDNLLMSLILKCINNDPTLRPQATEIEKRLAELVVEFPAYNLHQLEVVRTVQSLTDEVEKLKSQVKLLKDQISTENELVASAIETLQKVQKKKTTNKQLKERVEVSTSRNKHKAVFTIMKEDRSLNTKTKPTRHNRKFECEPNQQDLPSEKQRDCVLSMKTVTSLLDLEDGQASSSVQSFLSCPIFIGNYSYEARSSSDLRFAKGDHLFITDMNDSEWWYARSLRTSMEGFVPRNHLAEVNICEVDQERFQLKKKLGKGTFFEVWDGYWDENLPVAVKIVSEEFTVSSEYIDELARIKQLTHPNIVPLIAAITHDGPLQIITELFEQGSLLEYLHRDGRYLMFSQLIEAAAQVAEGMAFLEEQNYVHQNLAARNVMITDTLMCKIADFGFARLIEQADIFTIISSNARWRAPEALSSNLCTIKSDVWSYGIVLYEIITYGSVPYKKMSNEAVLEKVQNGYCLPCPSGCPKSLCNIMLSCWNRLPEKRPSFALLRKQLTEYHNSVSGGYEYVP